MNGNIDKGGPPAPEFGFTPGASIGFRYGSSAGARDRPGGNPWAAAAAIAAADTPVAAAATAGFLLGECLGIGSDDFMLTCGGGTLPALQFLLVPGLATEDTVISRLVDKSRSSISGLSVLDDLPFLFVDARLRSNISISGLVLLLSLHKSLTSVVGLPYMCLDWEYTDGDWKTLGGSGPIGSRRDLVTGCWCAAGAGAGKMLVCGKSCANALIVLLL